MTANDPGGRALAWVMNLDADDELTRPSGYTPRPARAERTSTLLPRLAALFRPGDVVLCEGGSLPAEGTLGPGVSALALGHARLDSACFEARAWCPTPRAARLLANLGLPLGGAPSVAVLRAVNGRRFTAALGQGLPDAQLVETFTQLQSVLQSASPTGLWLCKREHSFAGRGRRRFASAELDEAERAWARASLREGGCLQVEPLVRRTADYALHGFVSADGAAHYGEPTTQDCDEQGVWLRSRRAGPGELASAELDALARSTAEAGQALHAAGYAGPFGVDAYRWLDAHERPRFNALCELNARYSMGWAIGMGERRPDRT